MWNKTGAVAGPTYQYSRILFGPSLEEASARDLHNGEGKASLLLLQALVLTLSIPALSPFSGLQNLIIMMYIYHVLINALSTHVIHINCSPTKTIYIKYYKLEIESHRIIRSMKILTAPYLFIDSALHLLSSPPTTTTTLTTTTTHFSPTTHPLPLHVLGSFTSSTLSSG